MPAAIYSMSEIASTKDDPMSRFPNQSTTDADRPDRFGHRAMPRRVAPNPVLVQIVGTVAVAAGAPARLLAPALETTRRAYVEGGPRGFLATEARGSLLHAEPGGVLGFLAGLVPLVVATLERAGHPVEVGDRTPLRPRMRLDEAGIGKRGGESLALTRLIAGQPRGQFVIPHRERCDLVAMIARAFPEAAIAVAVATRGEAKAIGHQLRKRFAEPVAIFYGQVYLSEVRVCTFSSLDPREEDIIVFADSAAALHDKASDVFNLMVNQHVYGLTAPTLRRGA